MKNITSSTKTVIVFVAILIIGGLMYFYTLGGPTDESINSIDQTAVAGDESTRIVAAKVLTLLNQINSLNIDKTLFDDPLYAILLDHTVAIPAQNVGRANPFAPYYTPVVTPTGGGR